MVIEDWAVVLGGDASVAPETRPRVLRGKVYGHPERKDGTPIKTSDIVEIKLSERICQTRSQVYRLGEPHPEYAKRYPESKLAMSDNESVGAAEDQTQV